VVDAKLSRTAKVGAVLQVCSYSEMLERAQGAPPALMHLALGGPREDGSDDLQTFLYGHFAAYYRSVKSHFQGIGESDIAPATYPEPCDHCAVCDWSPVCNARWREDDHLSLVAGITRKQRGALEDRGTATLEALAELPLPLEPPLEGVGAPALGRMYDDGLSYLFGYVDTDGAFTALWALDHEQERRHFETFVDTVVARLEEWPGMHVYHYAPLEPTTLKRLANRYATRENEIHRMLRGGVLVDLHRVVRQGVRASVESYSIKKLEPFYGFDRDVELRAASSALAHFEAWLQVQTCHGVVHRDDVTTSGGREPPERSEKGTGRALPLGLQVCWRSRPVHVLREVGERVGEVGGDGGMMVGGARSRPSRGMEHIVGRPPHPS
jgi:uncharacterized protein